MKACVLLLMTAGLLYAAPAKAEWYRVVTSSSGSAWYLDPDRMKVTNGKVKAWVKVDGSADRTVSWRESKRLVSFNCSADTYRMLSYVNYDSYGKITASHNYPEYGYGSSYEPIVPDSVMESLSKLACLLSSE